MSANDRDDEIPHEEESKVNDKHNWGAADLEKVTHVGADEEKDDLKVSSDALGKLISGPQQPAQKIVNIKKEDLQLIMSELELPKVVVEKKLIEVNGDPVAAMRSLLNF